MRPRRARRRRARPRDHRRRLRPTAVEYFNSAFGHYFVTAFPAEVAALDAGRFDQWSRTGLSFGVWNGGAGLDDVCRFFTTAFPPKSSHFYTPDAVECGKVRANPDWTFEGIAFNTVRPDDDGRCPAFATPLYRLYNQAQGGAPNHRYTTSVAVRAGMLQRDWRPEGYGEAGVIACVPPWMSSPPAVAPLRITGNNPLPAKCDGGVPTGSLFAGAEVEPHLAVDPANPDRLVGVWQQNRWSNGGAQALLAATSADGGRTWTASRARFSRCAGGGDERASDPWVSIGADGVVYHAALALTGQSFAAGSSNAILVARSLDGGLSWDDPVTVRRDGADVFSDKESITADPTDARFAYVVWDRLNRSGGGPLFFARTGDRGASWEPARVILDTPATAQTINNQVVVAADGTLVNFYTWLQVTPPLNTTTGALRVIRSTDKGATWDAPVEIAKQQSLGVRDPDTGERVRDAAILGHVAAGRNGRLAAVWQDARFSGGVRDGIAFSRSDDGGRSWTAPVQVNRVPSAAAFVPAVAIADDGIDRRQLLRFSQQHARCELAADRLLAGTFGRRRRFLVRTARRRAVRPRCGAARQWTLPRRLHGAGGDRCRLRRAVRGDQSGQHRQRDRHLRRAGAGRPGRRRVGGRDRHRAACAGVAADPGFRRDAGRCDTRGDAAPPSRLGVAAAAAGRDPGALRRGPPRAAGVSAARPARRRRPA